MTGDLHDEIRDRLNRRRQGNERIIRDLLKDANFKHLSPEVLEGIITVIRDEEAAKKAAKKAAPTADQAALEHVRVLLASSTWWATAAYGVGRDRADFFVWTDEHWERRTPQEIVGLLRITDESLDLKNKALGYLSTLAQVQGPPDRDQLGFRLAVTNGVLDFQTGDFRPAAPEDKLVTTIRRRYLLPHERVPEAENRVYVVLSAYSPQVRRIVLQSLLPRAVAPWPGGKIFYLVGPPGTGKSKLISLLKRILEGATAGVSADRLRRSQFVSLRLDGMLANITSENRRSEIRDSEAWKDEADQLWFEVEEKHGRSFEARFMATAIKACNLLPFLPGLGSEFFRRIFPIPFLRRLKGTDAGTDDIERVIRELTDEELDSVFSDAVDVADTCGPEGTYPGDLDDDTIERLYMDLTDGLRLFMQSKLKWSNPEEYVTLADVVDAYRSSDYSLVDREKGKRDERGTYTLFEAARLVGASMGGSVGLRRQAHGNAPQVLFGLTWAATDRGRGAAVTAFLVDEDIPNCEKSEPSENWGGEKALCDAGFPHDTPFSKNITHGGKGSEKNVTHFPGKINMTPKTPVSGETPCESREIIPPNFSEVADNTNDGGYGPSCYEVD